MTNTVVTHKFKGHADLVYTEAQPLLSGEQDKLTVARLTGREITLDLSWFDLLASGLER